MKARIEKFCKNNPEFSREVRQKIQIWETERNSRKNRVDNATASNVSEIYDGQDNIGAATLAGSASSCTPFNSVILDSGTNVKK